jgi:hypothetical protein
MNKATALRMTRIGLGIFLTGVAILMAMFSIVSADGVRSSWTWTIIVTCFGIAALAGYLAAAKGQEAVLSINRHHQERLRLAFVSTLTEEQLRRYAAAESWCSCGVDLSGSIAEKLHVDHAAIDRGRGELAELADRQEEIR